ncbi:MAG: hypothetical protein GYB36_12275 [Alphaproteobacteria bacterium]|nr:hypothetical protein [Alphaproteobacteria bacterium]
MDYASENATKSSELAQAAFNLTLPVNVLSEDGQRSTVTPFALADTGDGDYNHLLCLDTTAPAVSISFPAGHLTDPREDLNPDTSVVINPAVLAQP